MKLINIKIKVVAPDSHRLSCATWTINMLLLPPYTAY